MALYGAQRILVAVKFTADYKFGNMSMISTFS